MRCTDDGDFCEFEPRYDLVRSEGKWPINVDDAEFSSIDAMVKFMRETQKLEKIYIHDICVKCGAVVKR